MRALAVKLAAAFTRLMGQEVDFWPAWEQEVRQGVREQQRRPPPIVAPHPVDGPSERTTVVQAQRPLRVTHVGVRLLADPPAPPAPLVDPAVARPAVSASR